MGRRQFYIEQGFTTHPKIVRAGGDAGWLWMCAMDWATENLTGQVPKVLVPQLSDRKRPMVLAQRLCEIGLWHDKGDHYEIHDFEVRNQKTLSARRKAKQAAEARWHPPTGDAPSIDQALLNGCTSNASRAGDPKIQRSKEPVANGLQQQEQASTDPVENPAAAAADGRMVDAALEVIYSRRPPALTNPKAHKRATLAGLRSDLAGEIARLDWSVPWTPETLADWLEPAAKPVPKQEPAEPRSPVTWFPGCEPHKEPA